MKTLNLIQGSPEWHQHRASHWNASDAPAMLGVSPCKTRAQLVREVATGFVPEVDAATQKRFDDGHRFEALARPLAEKVVGDELYPCTGESDEDPRLSASFDGLTMDGQTAWEHKTLNDELRAAISLDFQGDLPLHYRVQMQQQLIVSGAERILFMASKWDGDVLIEERHFWYENDPHLALQICSGWQQFEADVAAYQPEPEAAPAPAGRAPDQLPALRIEVTGMVTASNLAEFRENALAVIKSINTDLQTDEHFADAEKTVKWCQGVEDRLDAAKQHALSQTASIDELFRTIDAIAEETRAKRLELNRLVKSRKDAIRLEIAHEGKARIDEHVAKLNERIAPVRLPAPVYSINDAMKGKRTIATLRGAVDDEVARVKIATNAQADAIDANLRAIREKAPDHQFLFADLQALALKPHDDLLTLIAARITEHGAKEKARIEAERERIRAEEAAKLKAAQAAQAAQEAQEAAPVQSAPVAGPVASPAPAQSPVRQAAENRRDRPTDREIIDALALHFRVHDSKVIEWLLAMDLEAESNALMEQF